LDAGAAAGGSGEEPGFNGPALQQSYVVALRDLKATAEISRNPAAEKVYSVWHQPSFLAERAVDGLCVLIAKALDNHKQHRPFLKSIARTV
jgi:hypothetical protein